MHVISKKKLRAFWTEHHDAELPLAAWFKIAEKAKWEKWADVHKADPKASYFECCLIFNICGNSYRLVVKRAENWKTLFVVGVFTHAEYDRDSWKKFCGCQRAATTDGSETWPAKKPPRQRGRKRQR